MAHGECGGGEQIRLRVNHDRVHVEPVYQSVKLAKPHVARKPEARHERRTASAIPPADSDRGGLPDAMEVSLGTNPANPDSDGDPLLDGVEVRYYASDPLTKNTDGDQCDDGKEAASLNEDVRVDSTDILIVAQSYGPSFGTKYVLDFDVNKDGVINSTDSLIQAKVFGPCVWN